MKKLLAIVLVLCLMLSGLTVHASETLISENTEDEETQEITGGYMLDGISSEEGESFGIIAAAIDLGINFYLILEEDGTGRMNFIGKDIPLTWDDDSINFTGAQAADEDDDDDDADEEDDETEGFSIPYVCSDGSLKIHTDAYSMDFTKMSDKEYKKFLRDGTDLEGLTGAILQGLMDSTGIGDIVTDIVFDLAFGSMAEAPEKEPIPEGEPTEEPVTGIIDGLEVTVVGSAFIIKGTDVDDFDEVEVDEDDADEAEVDADEAEVDEDDEIEDDADEDEAVEEEIVFTVFYDITNTTDEVQELWHYSTDAYQDGEFLDWAMADIEEEGNIDFDILPGTTLRCAMSFDADQDGGVIGFRLSSYDNEDDVILYYVDPQNPIEPDPFVFEANDEIPEIFADIPNEADDMRIDKVEFFTNEDGENVVAFYFWFKNTTDTENTWAILHDRAAYQDGISLFEYYEDQVDEAADRFETVQPGEEIYTAMCYRLRSDGKVIFTVSFREDYGIPTILELVWAEEVPEAEE